MEQPTVTIEQGTLCGAVATDFRGNSYFRFQGIPYAKPPTGDLRFKAPQPPEKWNGILDASKEGNACYSRHLIHPEKIIGSENCLFLNVYTKNMKGNRSVMFWIHGGGFRSGSGDTEFYGPDFLLTEDVVLVTINYRLGMLGFLRFEDPLLAVPGNAGFKDMVMALKWVQNNISSFGGDPGNVTIFGQSAGGAAVHLLLLSPLSEGLFHKAIAQSGCALNHWVTADETVQSIAEVLDLQNADDATIYKHLKELTVERILEIEDKVFCKYDLNPSKKLPFRLVIENKSDKSAFLTDDPISLILNGKFHQVPFMIGYTNGEGLIIDMFRTPGKIKFDEMIPWMFGYHENSPDKMLVASKIESFYFGKEQQLEGNQQSFYTLFTDIIYLYGIYVTVINQFHQSKSPTYLYRVSLETKLDFFKKVVNINLPGVCHGDDLNYLFKTAATPIIKPGSAEDIAINKFVKLWTNFAKMGNPTTEQNSLEVTWKPVTSIQLDFLDIGVELVSSSEPDAERMNFWTNLFASSPAGQITQCAYLKERF